MSSAIGRSADRHPVESRPPPGLGSGLLPGTPGGGLRTGIRRQRPAGQGDRDAALGVAAGRHRQVARSRPPRRRRRGRPRTPRPLAAAAPGRRMSRHRIARGEGGDHGLIRPAGRAGGSAARRRPEGVGPARDRPHRRDAPPQVQELRLGGLTWKGRTARYRVAVRAAGRRGSSGGSARRRLERPGSPTAKAVMRSSQSSWRQVTVGMGRQPSARVCSVVDVGPGEQLPVHLQERLHARTARRPVSSGAVLAEQALLRDRRPRPPRSSRPARPGGRGGRRRAARRRPWRRRTPRAWPRRPGARWSARAASAAAATVPAAGAAAGSGPRSRAGRGSRARRRRPTVVCSTRQPRPSSEASTA